MNFIFNNLFLFLILFFLPARQQLQQSLLFRNGVEVQVPGGGPLHVSLTHSSETRWCGSVNRPPTSVLSFDLGDSNKVRAVLNDVLQKGPAHFQHGILLMQDVNVVRVSSWLHAESMNGAPGFFEENNVEQTVRL